jgi:hypothetical protein
MSSFNPTSGPQNIPLRPLNKGMIRNLPSNGLPEGAVWTAKNYNVGMMGPKRRSTYSTYGSGTAFSFPPLRNLMVLFLPGGSKHLVGVDRRLLYEVGQTALTRHTWDWNTGTILASSGDMTVRGTSTFWTSAAAGLQVGDVMHLSPTESIAEMVEIAGITSSGNIDLSSFPAHTHPAGSSYAVYKGFKSVNPYTIDWTVVDNKLVLADSARPLFSYDGATFGPYDASYTWIPTGVTYFRDRLWCIRIVQSGVDYRHRIVWSKTTDHTDFDITGRYVDLPYSSGYGMRLVGLGNLLIAYFEDAVYFGRPTNIAGDGLPMAFERIDTGGVGLVGGRAVVSWLDGHFFVGNDDIYYLSTKGFERIGSPVVDETIRSTSETWGVYAAVDAERDRVVFGFPGEEGTQLTKLWSFDYKAKAWSYDEVACTMIAGAESSSTIEWDTLDSAIPVNDWDTGMQVFESWDAIQAPSGRRFFLGVSGVLSYLTGDGGTTDSSSIPVTAVLETGDFDDNLPNLKKTTTRLSVKIDSFLSSDLTFTVEFSMDRGRTWRSGGTLTIPAGDDEGYVNFLATGSTIRFRLTSSSEVASYRIMEIVRRTKGRGVELHLGPSD